MSQNGFLLKFSFGPVHDFIAAARKLEDLCAGSMMLSTLMKSIMEYIDGTLGGVIIYPQSATKKSSAANYPNILIADFKQTPNLGKPSKVAANVSEKAHEQLVTLAGISSHTFDTGSFEAFDSTYNRQWNSFLDITWSFARYADASEHIKALQELNKRFDAAKRTRLFQQLENEEGLKCTLQANLGVLRPANSGSKDREVKKAWDELRDRLLRDTKKYFWRIGEHFSAVGLSKRLYGRKAGITPYPSTYNIASGPWRRHLLGCDDEDVTTALDSFHKAVKNQREKDPEDVNSIDPHSLPALNTIYQQHSGRRHADLLVKTEPKCFYRVDDFQEIEVKDAGKTRGVGPDPLDAQRRNLFNSVETYAENHPEESVKKQPSGHYAMLMADGDSMGEIVDNRSDIEDLTNLSTALHSFADAAAGFIDNSDNLGRTMYAGGDDVFAVLPVETALTAACSLFAHYHQALQGFTWQKNGKTLTPTLSAALIIAPVSYPLNRLTDVAHQLLNTEAKAGDKNALTLAVFKRGGEVSQVTLPVEVPRDDHTTWKFDDWAKKAIEMLDNKSLSSSTMYDIRRMIQPFGETNSIYEMSLEHFRREIDARIHTNRQLEEEAARRVSDLIAEFIEAMEVATERRGKRFRDPSLISETLICMRNLRMLT